MRLQYKTKSVTRDLHILISPNTTQHLPCIERFYNFYIQSTLPLNFKSNNTKLDSFLHQTNSHLTLVFKKSVLLLQIINVLLVSGILLPHELNVIGSFFQYLCTAGLRRLLSLVKTNHSSDQSLLH